MIRAHRRDLPEKPVVITAGMALNYELNDAWPSFSLRCAFWTGPRVPRDLMDWNRPDPRKVLLGEEGKAEHDAENEAWINKRLSWLEKEARRG